MMTMGQQALWTLCKLTPTSAVGNLCTALRLTPDVRIERLRAALTAIYSQHDILRARVVDDVIPHLEIGDAESMVFTTRVVMDWDDADRDAWLETECHQPIDPREGTCRFALLLRMTGGRVTVEAILLIALHHLVSDFRSVEILTQDLEKVYHSRDSTTVSSDAHQFIEYARHEARWLTSSEAQRQRDFWRAELNAMHALPSCRTPPSSRTGLGFERRVALSARTTQAVRAASRQCGVTPFAFTLALFGVLVAAIWSQRSLAVGTTVDLRRERALRRTVGYLVNTVPVIMNIEPSSSLASFASAVSVSVGTSMRHSRLPFAEIAQCLRSSLQPRQLPTLFTWLKFEPDFGTEDAGKLILDTLRSSHYRAIALSQALALSIEDRREHLECLCAFDTGALPRALGDQLATSFASLLERASGDAACRVGELLDHVRGELVPQQDAVETLEL